MPKNPTPPEPICRDGGELPENNSPQTRDSEEPVPPPLTEAQLRLLRCLVGDVVKIANKRLKNRTRSAKRRKKQL